MEQKEIIRLADKAEAAKIILVFDEAYMEYFKPGPDFLTLDFVRQQRNVIVLRTFSKIYGLAGLRCGYALAAPELIARMKRIRNALPFNVNRLAQASAQGQVQFVGEGRKARDIGKQRAAAGAVGKRCVLSEGAQAVLGEVTAQVHHVSPLRSVEDHPSC